MAQLLLLILFDNKGNLVVSYFTCFFVIFISSVTAFVVFTGRSYPIACSPDFCKSGIMVKQVWSRKWLLLLPSGGAPNVPIQKFPYLYFYSGTTSSIIKCSSCGKWDLFWKTMGKTIWLESALGFLSRPNERAPWPTLYPSLILTISWFTLSETRNDGTSRVFLSASFI